MDDVQLFSLTEVAEMLRISPRALADAARAKKIEHHRLHGKRYMSRSQIDAYLARTRVGPAQVRPLGDDLKARFLDDYNRRLGESTRKGKLPE